MFGKGCSERIGREWASWEETNKRKYQKGFTRADLGIVEIKFAATGGSWELFQVIEVSSSPKFFSCKGCLTLWCQSITTSGQAMNETLKNASELLPISYFPPESWGQLGGKRYSAEGWSSLRTERRGQRILWVTLWHSLACSYNVWFFQSLPWSFPGILFLCILCSFFNQNCPAVAKAPKQESQRTRHQFYSYHTEELSDLYKLTSIFLLLFSRQVMSNSLRLHELQHTRLPCTSLSRGVCPNSCPLHQWCCLTISSSAVWEFSFPRIRVISHVHPSITF